VPPGFHIFVNLTLIANPNSNPGPVTMDFLNTATFSIQADPGVTYTLLSRAFLDSAGVPVVPAPAALPLLVSGLAWASVGHPGGLDPLALLARRRI